MLQQARAAPRPIRPFPMSLGAPSAWLPWLAGAALCDWLIARILARSAIYMPKTPAVSLVYQGLTWLGNAAAAFAALLALGLLAWIAWEAWAQRALPGLALALGCLLALGVLFLFVAPGGWLSVACHLLLAAAILLVVLPREGGGPPARFAPALALLCGGLYQLAHALYAALHWPGPPPFALTLFNLGELLAVLTPAALWWAYGRGAPWRVWAWAALPAVGFAAARVLNPAIAGILAIWSTGLTLYLPWPLYALSLWLAGVTVLVSLRREGRIRDYWLLAGPRPAVWPVRDGPGARGEQLAESAVGGECARRGGAGGLALLLLAAGGYAPGSSAQAWLGLIALWLLAASPMVSLPCQRRSS